jgi:hypothetical protein
MDTVVQAARCRCELAYLMAVRHGGFEGVVNTARYAVACELVAVKGSSRMSNLRWVIAGRPNGGRVSASQRFAGEVAGMQI